MKNRLFFKLYNFNFKAESTRVKQVIEQILQFQVNNNVG